MKYFIGFLRNLFKRNVSLFALVDNVSEVSKKAKIYRFCQVFNSTIGDYSYVASGTSIIYATVGKFCSIADDCIIGMGTHSLNKLSTCSLFTEKKNGTGISWSNIDCVYPFIPVKVGNDVWIGERVMVMGGVSIGDGAVIGAGSIVTKDVPPYAIVVGVPARVIKYRFEQDIIEELRAIKWWDKNEKTIKRGICYFQEDNINIQGLKEYFNSEL